MRNILLTLMALNGHLALADAGKLTTVISAQREDSRTSYKISIFNNQPSMSIFIVGYGESCGLGKIINQGRYAFDQIPILYNQGHFKPHIATNSDIFTVDADNYLKLSSIDGRSGDLKKPFIDEHSSKDLILYTIKQNNDLMLNLPLCIHAAGGAKDDIEAIVSEEEWSDVDATLNLDAAIKSCKDRFPGVKVDPNEGDHRYQCKDPKYEYLSALTELRFACVIEKRLENRLSNVTKNKNLIALQDKPSPEWNIKKLHDSYLKSLELYSNNLSLSMNHQKKEIEGRRERSEKLLATISKSCKS